MKRPAYFIAFLLALFTAQAAEKKIYRLLPVGDSITEGGITFSNYRFPLWEKLFEAGYLVEFVGSRSSDTRIGPLQHEGHSGKNAEFLAGAVENYFRTNSADIMLIHSGHTDGRRIKSRSWLRFIVTKLMR